MKLSFSMKLFLIIIAIILSTASCIGIFTYKSVYDSLKSDIISSSAREMQQVDRELQNIFDYIKRDTIYLASNSFVMQADNSVLGVLKASENPNEKKYSEKAYGIECMIFRELEKHAKTHPEASFVYLGTKWGGFVQYPDGVRMNGYDPRKRDWYEKALQAPDGVILTDPYVSADEKNSLIVSTASAVKDNDGNTIGVLGMDITLEKLSEIIKKIKIGTEGYLFMYTKDGIIMTHPNHELIFKDLQFLSTRNDASKRAEDRFIFKDYERLIGEYEGLIETTINNIPVMVNIATSPSTGWKMASVVKKSELTGRANNMGFSIVLITLIVIAVSILATHFITEKVTTPLKDITNLMIEAGNGNLSVQAKASSRDEFGQLSLGFNSMLQKLSTSYDELSAVHEELIATDEELRAQYDELLSSEEALRNSEERYRLALDGSNDAIWEWDLETFEFFASDKWYDITGYNSTSILNYDRLTKYIIHPEDVEKTINKLQDHLCGKNDFLKAEFRIRMANDCYKWIYCRGKALKSTDGKPKKIAGSITDITSRKLSEEKMRHMAYFDSLTDLPNRAMFMKSLKVELGKATTEGAKGAVLFIDLDNFKNINDTLGHDYGDKLLIELSQKLNLLKRDKDIICRFSGDEFLILHPFHDNEELITYAEELMDIFNGALQVQEKQIHITASVGISLYPVHGTDANSLLKNADTAMYKAKDSGKGTYAFYDTEMYMALQRKANIEEILRTAIEKNEFTLLYQPQYNISDGSICGFEALLRLNCKELGFISPAEFIPIAEETGYIVEIGSWVLTSACLQAAHWRSKGLNFACIGVNISSIQIHQPGFVAMVKEVIAETGITPESLELEITETVLMKSLDSNIEILKDLRDMGIRIALDDFGTGYSSLNYLRKIPITTLKVDKSFIDNLCSSTKEKAIIESIIEMAHHMDLKVVAEGVETAEQLHILNDKYCDKVQGYLFSKPLPAIDAENLIKKA